MRIQLAIQGGGAKLVTLLAAACAVQELQSKGQLELTRVVGTSAGAMVGTLLAAGVDLEKFREKLKGGLGKKLYESLSAPSKTAWAWTLTKGAALRKTDVLAGVIANALTERGTELGKPLLTLEDLYNATGVEMRIVAADLRSTVPHVYRPNLETKGAKTLILSALLDSAGIPFYFKTWLHGPLVDGGLVQNFPWEELVDNETERFGKILGISFFSKPPQKGQALVAEAADDAGNIDPLKTRGGFITALLNTALDATTERARTRLGSDRVLSLVPAYDTFDFQNGLGIEALGNHFDLERLKALEWFENRLDNGGITIESDPWSSASLPMMEKLGQMYELQHKGSLLHYHSAALEISGHGLKGRREPDVVRYSFSFSTLGDNVYCHTIALSQRATSNGSFKKSEITLINPDGQVISTDYLPIYDSVTPEKREILLFFSEVLPMNSGPYTLHISDFVQDLTHHLIENKSDVLLVRVARTVLPVAKMEIVMHVPQEFGGVKMDEWPERDKLQVPGTSMSQAELINFRPPSPGWLTRGWVGVDVLPAESFGPIVSL